MTERLESERLQKVIAKAGVASRRHAEQLILEGRVQVNGSVITQLGTKVDPSKDFIRVDGKRIQPETHKIYLLLNKPKGYITSVRDPQGRPTVMDLIPKIKERVYPVGRLDYDSEGLLLLTNDGDFAEALMHPRSGINKTYWVKVEGHLAEEKIKKIALGGIPLPGGRSAPARIRPLRKTSEHDWVEIVLHEGKRRQIRMMIEKLGHDVLKLKRVGYAFLELGDLASGEHRRLTSDEVKGLKALVSKRAVKAVKKEPAKSKREAVRSKRGGKVS
ncbi:MAG: rRNA pseudouridine synthase [Nitrospirae bacterium]|nr:rRNA pseudouridine synthase [Candidatus Manganitrophaceae bacterium]